MGDMRIIKVSLPIVALPVVFATVAKNKLDKQIAATADAGMLPETAVIGKKLFARGVWKDVKVESTRLAVVDGRR